MNTPLKKSTLPATQDDQQIPVLTERLGLPPLDFDTTLPMIDTTLPGLSTGSLRMAPDLDRLTALPTLPDLPPNVRSEPRPEPQITATPLPPITAFTEPLPAAIVPVPPAAAPAPQPTPRVAPAPNPVAVADPSAGPGAPLAMSAAATLTGTQPAATTAPIPAASPPDLGATAATGNDGRHWARIEIDLRTAVLNEISRQLPREIQTVVRRQMVPAIEALLAGLVAETQRAVALCLQELIEHAVRAELERLRISGRGPE